MATGIKETKDVLSFVFSLGEGVGKSLEDGKITITDIINFYSAFSEASAAFVGLENVPKEMADLDEAEAAELLAWCKENFDLPQDSIEAAIEYGLQIAYNLFLLIKQWAK